MLDIIENAPRTTEVLRLVDTQTMLHGMYQVLNQESKEKTVTSVPAIRLVAPEDSLTAYILPSGTPEHYLWVDEYPWETRQYRFTRVELIMCLKQFFAEGEETEEGEKNNV